MIRAGRTDVDDRVAMGIQGSLALVVVRRSSVYLAAIDSFAGSSMMSIDLRNAAWPIHVFVTQT